MAETIQNVSLQDETERRYLTYAVSGITSRALPAVRDGLKPVQRRTLYAIYHTLGLLLRRAPQQPRGADQVHAHPRAHPGPPPAPQNEKRGGRGPPARRPRPRRRRVGERDVLGGHRVQKGVGWHRGLVAHILRSS